MLNNNLNHKVKITSNFKTIYKVMHTFPHLKYKNYEQFYVKSIAVYIALVIINERSMVS